MMSDPMMAASSMPVPTYQTMQGTRDPLPVSSPKLIEKTATTRLDDDRQDAGEDFKAYLDQTSITLVEKDQRKRLDAADLISQTSIYQQPGANVPL